MSVVRLTVLTFKLFISVHRIHIPVQRHAKEPALAFLNHVPFG